MSSKALAATHFMSISVSRISLDFLGYGDRFLFRIKWQNDDEAAGRLIGTPVGNNEPRQGQGQGLGQGQGQDHEKVRQRSALLQLQMVLALTLTLVLVLTLALAPSGMISKKGVPKFCPSTVVHKNGHETDFYKAKRGIDDMNLHKKTRRIQLK